jgi:crossover junction endodeoxyribonuclease RuvC
MFDDVARGRTVLGIDPGLSRCGFGAVAERAGGPRALRYGTLRTDARVPVPERLAALLGDLEVLLDDVDPAVVVVERVLFQTNVRTAISVGQASGLALALAARRGIPVVQYSPNEVKLAVAGDGGADKVAVQTMVARLLGLRARPEPADAADALALALTHARGARRRAVVPETAGAGTTGFEQAVAAALARREER